MKEPAAPLKPARTDAADVAVIHEISYLVCGRLGSSNVQFWPDKRGCRERLKSKIRLRYLRIGSKMPPINLDIVMKAMGLIVQEKQEKLPLRKEPKNEL